MNKVILGIAAIGLSSSLAVAAAQPTETAASFQINIPNLKSGMLFNLTGMYLRPTNNDLDYVAVIKPTVDSTTNVHLYSVKPGHRLGFRIGMGYIFPNSGNDVQVSWTHFNMSKSASIGINTTGTMFGSSEVPRLFFIGPPERGAADGHVHFKYNVGDLNVGQYVTGTRLQARFFAGLRYASISRDFDRSMLDAEKVPIGSIQAYGATLIDHSEFQGVGPRFGVASRYRITNCFGLVGQVAASVLAGKISAEHQNAFIVFFTNGPAESATSVNHIDTVHRVVPEFDGKLGLDYTYAYNTSIFDITAGYQVTHYINAIDRFRTNTVNDEGDPLTFSHKTSSIGFSGPYLSLNLKVT